MALKPIGSAEFFDEVEKLVINMGKGVGGLITSVDYIQKQLKEQGFQFSPEELRSALNTFLREGRAKLGVLCVSEYQPDVLSVNIEFDLKKKET